MEARQLTGNMEAAQKLARQIDHELVDLIDYLRRALTYLEANENLLIQHEPQRRSKLQNLLAQTEHLREQVTGKVGTVAHDWTDRITHVWNDARDLVTGKTKETAQKYHRPSYDISGGGTQSKIVQTWNDLFYSSDWTEFFREHPHLDPREWKDYLQSHLPSPPTNWQQNILQSANLPPTRYYNQQQQLPSRPSYQSIGYDQAPTTTITATEIYLPFAMFYLFLIVYRVLKARKTAQIYVGDGTVELLVQSQTQQGQNEQLQPGGNIMKETVEKSHLFQPVTHLAASLEGLNLFCQFTPFVFLAVGLLEYQIGIARRAIHILYLLYLIPMIYLVETCIKKTERRPSFQIFFLSWPVAFSLASIGLFGLAPLLTFFF